MYKYWTKDRYNSESQLKRRLNDVAVKKKSYNVNLTKNISDNLSTNVQLYNTVPLKKIALCEAIIALNK